MVQIYYFFFVLFLLDRDDWFSFFNPINGDFFVDYENIVGVGVDISVGIG